MATRPQTLDHLIEQIQQRWGDAALRPLAEVASPHAGGLSTGISRLDQMLGGEGMPRGAITCLTGSPSSGITTLALNTIATAQADDEIAIYIDGSHSLDPEYVVHGGIDLARLLVVRPLPLALGVDIVQDILLRGGRGVVVLDIRPHPLEQTHSAVRPATLRRLKVALAQTEYALIALTSAPAEPCGCALAHASDVHLQVENRRWLVRDQAVTGFDAHLTPLKNRFAPDHQAVTTSIPLHDTSSRAL